MTEKPQPLGCNPSKGLFNTDMGPLQRQLRAGEYNIFKWASMFEGDFVQVSKRGGTLDVHNQVRLVRVAIVATSPGMQVPNVLLLARPVHSSEQPLTPKRQQTTPKRQAKLRPAGPSMKFELTRLLPLCFVKISIHDLEKHQLRFKMATGRTFYLQLCPPTAGQADGFDTWVRVVHLLRPPSGEGEAKDQAFRVSPGLSLLHTPLPPLQDPASETTIASECTLTEILGPAPQQESLEKECLAEPPEPPENPQLIPEPLPPPPPETTSPELYPEPEGSPPSEDQSPTETLPPPSSEETEMEKAPEPSPPNRKKIPRSKSGKSRRSHSSKRAASRSPSKISSLFLSSFSSASHRYRKGYEKKR